MKIMLKGNKLFLEDGQLVYLTKEMLTKFSLKGKDFLTDEELESLMYFRVKLSAYAMLQKRDFFQKELKQKLREKHNFPEIVENVVEEFVEKGYLDDIEKAYSYARLHSNYGKRKLLYIFQQMGIDRAIIQEIISENDDNEIENIKNLWQKLGNKDYDKKIVSLMRKGFVYGDIKKAISSLEEEEE